LDSLQQISHIFKNTTTQVMMMQQQERANRRLQVLSQHIASSSNNTLNLEPCAIVSSAHLKQTKVTTHTIIIIIII
jgi:hypothetical protein